MADDISEGAEHGGDSASDVASTNSAVAVSTVGCHPSARIRPVVNIFMLSHHGTGR